MKNKRDNSNNNGNLPRRRRRPISEVLPELLEARGMSYNDVERETHGAVSHSLLSKMLSDKASSPPNPMLNTLIKLSDVLDVSVSQLIDEEIAEPEGFRQSKYYKLFRAEQQLKSAKLRKMIHRELDELLALAESQRWGK